jgi:hypothetical protein
MKVLLTGMVRRQVKDPLSMPNRYMSFFRCLRAALDYGGHDVDWRAVDIGEDLSAYDVAVIGLHGLGAMASNNHKWGALWAAHKLPHVPMLQDWRVSQILNELQQPPDRLWRCASYLSDKEFEQWTAAAKEPGISKVHEHWSGSKLYMIMAPVMRWGEPDDVKKLHPGIGRVEGWDPSPFYWRIEKNAPNEQKLRQWTCVSLTNQDDWIETKEISWPVSMAWKPKGRDKPASANFIDEEDLAALMGRSWGCLLPGYGGKMPVRGWWRARFLLAPRCGNVLAGDTPEFTGLPGCFQNSIRRIEWMKDHDLRNLSMAQEDAIAATLLSKEECAGHLTQILQRSVSREPAARATT